MLMVRIEEEEAAKHIGLATSLLLLNPLTQKSQFPLSEPSTLFDDAFSTELYPISQELFVANQHYLFAFPN